MRESDLEILGRVEHNTFQKGVNKHWKIGSDGNVFISSFCWIFCWAKTGMGNKKARKQARTAFDAIFRIPFDYYDSIISLEKAREYRYGQI